MNKCFQSHALKKRMRKILPKIFRHFMNGLMVVYKSVKMLRAISGEVRGICEDAVFTILFVAIIIALS